MATIKAYTDLEQSKKLTEILPLESADMWWSRCTIADFGDGILKISYSVEPCNISQFRNTNEDIPCWSLSALSEILKCCERCEITLRNDKQWNIFVVKDGNAFCSFEQRNGKGYGSQLDAYYDVVCWLKEHKFI